MVFFLFAFKMGDLSRFVCERALLSGSESRTHFPGQEAQKIKVRMQTDTFIDRVVRIYACMGFLQ